MVVHSAQASINPDHVYVNVDNTIMMIDNDNADGKAGTLNRDELKEVTERRDDVDARMPPQLTVQI